MKCVLIFRQTLLECLGNTSIHAVPKAVKSQQLVLRIFWLVCVIISAALCAFLLITTLISYLNYEVVSSSELQREVPQLFPTLTLCNSNPFVTEAGVAEMKKTYDKLLYLVVNAGNSDSDYDFFLNSSSDSVNGDASNVTMTRGYLDSVDQIAKTEIFLNLTAAQRQGLGLTLDQMLISCYFGYKTCSPSDFEYFYSVNLGNCYRFNSARNKSALRRTKVPGQQYGLKLELYVGQMPSADYYSYSTGIFVAVHNYTETPLIPDDGINLPTGRVNDLEISKSVYRLLETPSNLCVENTLSPSAFDSDLYRATFLFTSQYSQEICYKMCTQKYMIKKCNCYDINYPSMNLSSTPCRLDAIYCLRENLAAFSSDDFLATNCDPYCPVECETVNYDYSLTGNRYPTDGYASLLYRSSRLNFSQYVDSPATLKQNILQLNVFYGSVNFRVMSELRAMPLIVFLSNIGGTLGLFLGFSLLSLMEIFELLFMIFLNICQKRKKVSDLTEEVDLEDSKQ